MEKYDDEIRTLILDIQNNEAKIGLSLQEQPDLLDIRRSYQQDGGQFWIALDDEQVIGTIGLMIKERHCAALKKFFVKKEFRSRKVGLALYENLLEYAGKQDVRHIILDTPSVARVSHRFYEKAGFRKIVPDELPVAYSYPDRDSFLYMLDLNNLKLVEESAMEIRKYREQDLPEMTRIWNEVVEEGVAFPQLELLDEKTGKEFFAAQTFCGVAEDEGKVTGLYILHPNNVGRCGHIANASYAVDSSARGKHIGEKLISDCLIQARKAGFKLMQFNAVVESNIHARHLYERLGFVRLGTIPNGFLMKDGTYQNICLYYYEL